MSDLICDKCGDAIHDALEGWSVYYPTTNPTPSGVVCQDCWEEISSAMWWEECQAAYTGEVG